MYEQFVAVVKVVYTTPCHKADDGNILSILQILPTRLIPAVRNKLLRVCFHQLFTCRRYQTCWNNLLRVCWPHHIAWLKKQLV